jgi:adenylate cyclase
MTLIAELKRRNVFRVAFAYIIVAWLTIQVIDVLVPMLSLPDTLGRALILVLIVGFPIALLLAWAFELTPEGLKKEGDVDRSQSVTSNTGRKLDRMTIVVLVLAVAAFAVDKFVLVPDVAVPDAAIANVDLPPQDTERSIAVLPFVNMSGNVENEYFSDGLTETLLHMLAQIPDLKVAARTSSFAFKGDDSDIRTIAAALGVAHVLEGSVQRAGDRVRITAQLIRASDGFHVWSENYDRTLDDIFGIQDEIAEEVGGALSLSLLGNDHTIAAADLITESVDAYDVYLQALAAQRTGSYDGLDTAEELLRDALVIDPDFLDAKILLANVLVSQVWTGLTPQDEGLTRATAYLRQVLDVRPNDVHARASLAYSLVLKNIFDGNFAAAGEQIEVLRGVVREQPGEIDNVLMLASLISIFSRESEEAVALLENAVAVDPLNPKIFYELGGAHNSLKDWDAARSAYYESLRLLPDQPNAYWGLARTGLGSGDIIDYVGQALKMIEADPDDHEGPSLLARTLYELGLIDDADYYQSLAVTMSPTASNTRRNQLIRAIVTGEEGTSVELARRLIIEDVDDRRAAWQEAVRYLTAVALRRGTAAELLEFLDQQVPGFAEIGAQPDSMKVYDGWFLTAGARKGLMPDADIQEFLDGFVAAYKLIGDDMLSVPRINIQYLAVRGETSAAIEVALRDYFAEPVTANISWKRTLESPFMSDVVADPRVQAEMRRWDDEMAVMREQVREYLQAAGEGST